MLANSPIDFIEEGVIVKGETKALEGIFFEPEEEVVEREIKRPLTVTPEEYATSEKAKETGRENKKRSQALSRYHIRKALLDKQGRKYDGLYVCPDCLKRKKLRLYRIDKSNDPPKESDYLLLCDECITRKREENKKTKLWSRKLGAQGGSPENSKLNFLNQIRPSVFERDGGKCVFCGAKEELGLTSLIPEKRGGRVCFDNYVTCCQPCRGSKGNKLPLNYIWDEISFRYYLSEQLDDEPVVKNPGATVRVNMHLVAEMQQYFHRIAAGVEIDRSKAEYLAIKLSESDEDRKRERGQFAW